LSIGSGAHLYSGTAFGQTFPWTVYFGRSGADFATDFKQTSDNCYIITAYGGDGNSSNYYILKLNEYVMLQHPSTAFME
jgi:hypothetical protein